MTVSKRKEKCLADLDHLDREGLLLLSADNACEDLIGSMKDKIQIHGDIFTTSIEWDVQSWHTMPHP